MQWNNRQMITFSLHIQPIDIIVQCPLSSFPTVPKRRFSGFRSRKHKRIHDRIHLGTEFLAADVKRISKSQDE